MTDPDRAPVRDVDDHELLGQAVWIIEGDAGRRGRRQAWYAAYVAVIGMLAYGFPIAQTAFHTTDPRWLRGQLTSPLALLGLAVSLLAILWGAYSAGAFRGPVVPPLPWIDHVVSTPIDRAVSVRRWWRLSRGGTVFAGALLGATLGSGLAFAGVAPWPTVAPATVSGALIGWLASVLWLWGQVRSWPGAWPGTRPGVRSTAMLRALHAQSLRIHAANTSTIGGSVLAGNLRTARLQLARPVRHGRHVRLRASGPRTIIVRRDVLGLRRQPANLWSGLLLLLLGASVIVWTLTHPAAPVLAVALGLAPAYLGFGSWAEGLRSQADNVGTPSLLGTTPRAEAVAHLVVPTTLTLTAMGAGLLVAAALSQVTPSAVVVALALTLVLCGGHVLAAFRGNPPQSSLTPVSGPMLLVLWYVRPLLVVLIAGTLGAYLVERLGSAGLGWDLALGYAVVLWGLSRMQRLSEEHRV